MAKDNIVVLVHQVKKDYYFETIYEKKLTGGNRTWIVVIKPKHKKDK